MPARKPKSAVEDFCITLSYGMLLNLGAIIASDKRIAEALRANQPELYKTAKLYGDPNGSKRPTRFIFPTDYFDIRLSIRALDIDPQTIRWRLFQIYGDGFERAHACLKNATSIQGFSECWRNLVHDSYTAITKNNELSIADALSHISYALQSTVHVSMLVGLIPCEPPETFEKGSDLPLQFPENDEHILPKVSTLITLLSRRPDLRDQSKEQIRGELRRVATCDDDRKLAGGKGQHWDIAFAWLGYYRKDLWSAKFGWDMSRRGPWQNFTLSPADWEAVCRHIRPMREQVIAMERELAREPTRLELETWLRSSQEKELSDTAAGSKQ